MTIAQSPDSHTPLRAQSGAPPSPNGDLVFNVVTLTVLGSVFAHGMSAAPAADCYGRMAGDETHCPEEHKAVVEHPMRT